jgi:hypothetical protein
MANQLDISGAILGAPYGVRASFPSGTTGGDWETDRKYSILVGGWRTREEHDGFFFIPFNRIQNKWGASAAAPTNYETDAWNILNGGAGRTLLVEWSNPQHCGAFDHISVYYVPGDEDASPPDITENQFLLSRFIKVLPLAADQALINGEIPPYVTSVTISSAAAIERTRRVPVISGVVSTKTIVVPGNISISLPGSANTYPDGTSGYATVQVSDGAGGIATATVASATRSVAEGEGEITTIVISTMGTIAGDFTDAGYLEYNVGPLKLAGSDGYLWTSVVRTVTDLPYQHREKFAPDYKGDMVPLALLGDNDIDRISFSCAYPGVTAADHFDINKALRCGLPVLVSVSQDTTVARNLLSLTGYVRETNDLALRQMHNTGGRLTYDFIPDRQGDLWNAERDQGFIAISSITGGAGSSIIVEGDRTQMLKGGQAFYLRDAATASNDGLYEVDDDPAPAYTQSSDSTLIYVKNRRMTSDGAPAEGWIELVDL